MGRRVNDEQTVLKADVVRSLPFPVRPEAEQGVLPPPRPLLVEESPSPAVLKGNLPPIGLFEEGGQNIDAAYALMDFLLTPEINAKEVQAHGYPSTDARTNKLVPKEMLDNPVLYPAAELLAPLEFGAAATLTNPLRAEIMARVKAA